MADFTEDGGGTIPDIDLPDGTIPVVVGGKIVASSLFEDSTEVISGKILEATPASLKLGTNLVMSNHGEIIQFSNQAYGDETLPVVAFHDDSGSLTPVNYKLETSETLPSQILDGDSFSGTALPFAVAADFFGGTVLPDPYASLVLEMTFRGDGVQTDGMRITIRLVSHAGPIIWQSHNIVQFNAGVGFTINAAGDTTIRYEAPFITREGEILYITYDVLPANTISLKGNISGDFIPYNISKVQEITLQPMATEEFAIGAGAVISDATLTGDGSTGDPLSVVGSGTAWGDITGTLADQTDLQIELDGKAESGDNVSIFANDAGYLTANAVDSVNSKTGVVVLDKTDIGLANADNTSDAAKPISTATQTALDDKLATVSSDATLTGAGTSGDPLSVAGGGTTSKLYAVDEDNAATTNLTLNNWVLVNVSPTVILSDDFLHDGSGVFTYDGVDPKTFDFLAGLSQMGIGNDKTCEFAWFKNDVTQMMGKIDMDMSSSKFYGSVNPAAVVSLANGDNMRVCMRNTEDASNTTIVNSWFKIKEW